MNLKTITAEIDKKIANLNQLKVTVAELWELFPVKNGATRTRKAEQPRAKRIMSKQARARIAQAQRDRWAKWKKSQKAA